MKGGSNAASKMAEILNEPNAHQASPEKMIANVATLPTQRTAVEVSATDKLSHERAAQMAAVMDNPGVSQNVKDRYASMQKALATPSTPQAYIYVDKMVTVLPSSVRDVPNSLPIRTQRRVLKAMLGDALFGQVKEWALKHNFPKTALWLSQRISPLAKTRRVREIQIDAHPYDQSIDGNPNSEICQTLGAIFGPDTLFDLQGLAQLRNASLLDTVTALTKLVIEECELDRAKSMGGPDFYDDVD